MAREGIWITDEKTNERILVAYEDLDPDIYPKLLKPMGGFVYEANAFLHLPLPQVPYYIQNWLPKQGKAEIYGSAKSGKSFLCLQIARSIGAGEPILGIPTSQARVLYLQFELGTEILQQRMFSTGKDYADVYLGTTFSMQLDKSSGQNQLIEAMMAVKPHVLILDPFYKIISGDENEAQDVEVIMNFLDSYVIGELGCSVLIIHHSGKDLTRGGRGSSVLEGWVDSCIEIRKMSKAGERLRINLSPRLLRHAELPPKPLSAVLGNDFEFALEDEAERAETVLGKTRAKLEELGKAEASQLIEEGVGSRKSVYDALKILEKKELVVKEGREYIWKGRKKDGS